MKRRLGILVAVLALVLPFVMSDSATIQVTVQGAAPTVDNIVIAGTDVAATVSPSAGTTVSVSLAAEVTDNNGHGDISGVQCEITGPGTVQDSPVTMSAGTVIGSTTREYTGSFDMDFYDAAGTYTVNCSASDTTARKGDRQETFTYNSETALELDIDNGTIDFSNMIPGGVSTVDGDQNMGTSSAPTIQNIGNAVIDTQYSASGDLSGGGNTIPIGNLEVQFASEGFNALSTTAQTESDLDLAAGSSSLAKTDLRLTVPTGTSEATYSTTITISAT